MGIIFDIKKYALHDGPGIRTTVFFKGCPLACPWCHNPEGKRKSPELMWSSQDCIGCGVCVEKCPHHALSMDKKTLILERDLCDGCGTCALTCSTHALTMVGREVTEQAVLKDIKKDVLFYDQSGGGVTVSGGEPLMQPEFLQNLLQSCRDEGIHTAVDTCGYGPPEDMLVLAPHVDLFLYDIKVINDRNHLSMTGTSNALIHQNLEMLVEEKRNIRIRYPVIPSYNDDNEDINDLGEFLSSLKIMKITLLPYHTAGIHKTEQLLHHESPPCTIPLPSRELMEQISTTLIEYGLQVSVGG